MSKEVLHEVKNMLLMILLFLAIELLLFFFFGYFDLSVVWGALLGTAVSFINFFLLAVTVEISVKKGKGAAQGTMGTSYMLRLLFIAAAVVFAIKSAHINYIAAVIPLVFPRVAIMILNLINKKRGIKNDRS